MTVFIRLRPTFAAFFAGAGVSHTVAIAARNSVGRGSADSWQANNGTSGSLTITGSITTGVAAWT